MSQVIQGLLPAQSAGGGTSVTQIGEVSNVQGTDNVLSQVTLTSPSLVTGVATNNVTYNLRQLRAGSVVATLATITLGLGTNLAAETAVNVPITGTQAQITQLQDGDILDCQMVQNASGLASPASVLVQIEIS